VNLKSEEWKALTYINGTRTVEEIAEGLGMSEFDTGRILFKLHEDGLIEEGERPKSSASELVNGNFFGLLEEALAKAMGPMATIIIDEKVGMLKHERNAFPKNKLAKLIEYISNEISGESKRIGFQQAMLGVMKKI
jgi:hypothetical protein